MIIYEHLRVDRRGEEGDPPHLFTYVCGGRSPAFTHKRMARNCLRVSVRFFNLLVKEWRAIAYE